MLTLLLMQLGSAASKAVNSGITAYKVRSDRAYVLAAVEKEFATWKPPEHKGRNILPTALRKQFADALAGLAFEIAQAEAGVKAAA